MLWLMSAMRFVLGMPPVLFLVDDDRVQREAEETDSFLGMVRRPEQHDHVSVVGELLQLSLLLDNPGTSAVDDLEAYSARVRPPASPWRRSTTCWRLIDIVERVDRLNALRLELRDHAFVVNDLAEGVCRFALCERRDAHSRSPRALRGKPVAVRCEPAPTDPITDQVWSNPMADALDYLCRVCGERVSTVRSRSAQILLETRRSFDYLECPACGSIQIKDIPTDLAVHRPGHTGTSRGGRGRMLGAARCGRPQARGTSSAG